MEATCYANCKKVRNDKGYWDQIKHYISAEAEFTHGIYPDCAKEPYPGINITDN